MSLFGDTAPPHDYIAYVDEAGDPGIDSVQPVDPNGATEWLSVGATLISANREPEQVGWIRSIHSAIKSHQGAVLHFRKLSDRRKELACARIAELPLRAFVVASHKVNMRGYRNPAAEQYLGPRGWFYNWCIRVLLERLSGIVERNSIGRFGEPRHVKLVFSERGGVQYRWLSAYIELLMKQARDDATFLPKRVVRWKVLHPKLIEIVRHDASAGAQLADCVASAFYSAAHSRGSRWNTRAAELLRPCIAREQGFWFDFGVTLQPWRHTDRQKLTAEQKRFLNSTATISGESGGPRTPFSSSGWQVASARQPSWRLPPLQATSG